MLQAALDYQARGWSVIPLKPGTKVPALNSWKANQAQAWDRDQVLDWWGVPEHSSDNIGIVCGRVSGIWVLDIDGQIGVQSLRDVGIKVPTTRMVETPHGCHYYFAYDSGVTTGNGKLQNVDVKSDGSYVVAPPSVLSEMMP